jgi:hypothetical protein
MTDAANKIAQAVSAARAQWESEKIAELSQGGVLIRIGRPDGYEDTHPQLIAEDAINPRWPWYEILTPYD